ncbi:MAG: hypothetical protein IJT41_06370 [Clostridia bacterium]|nr:hypothetical protein [Clostridia bacterium]
MKKTLRITLLSDLCAGEGKHFAAVIDQDTALDAYGIPYIPARRIKGCMREVAEMIGVGAETIDTLFGVSGTEEGKLRLGQLRVKGYAQLIAPLLSGELTLSGSETNEIAEAFCTVRAQTAIEKDTLKDGSLRFIRVVNRYSPIDGEPLEFETVIEYPDDLNDIMNKICQGLRNIGYHRNRGLGWVRCTLEEIAADSVLPHAVTFDHDQRYRLAYTIRLQSDLMLPAADANHSLSYIPGTSVLGALAAKYNAKSDEDFNALFLSGKVCFGNAYISDAEGRDYRPAPRFLGRIKAATDPLDEGVQNILSDRISGSGKAFKPFKEGFITDDGTFQKPKTKIVYHNAVHADGLYMQFCLCAGQTFNGWIEAAGDAMEKLYPLFADGMLYFGRSKTAQYGRCEVIGQPVPEKINAAEPILVPKGQIAAYVCESDVALCSYTGTIGLETLEAYVKEKIARDDPLPFEILDESAAASRVISGYNAKWNLKKPQFPVISAGSALIFTMTQDASIPAEIQIGDKQGEGYGRLRLIPDAKAYPNAQEAPNTDKPTADEPTVSKLQTIIEEDRREDMLLENAVRDGVKIALNASQVGRLTLMCKQAGSYADFKKRIESIKTDKTRTIALHCFDLNKVTDAAASSDWKIQRKYILAALTVKKYQLRGENK